VYEADAVLLLLNNCAGVRAPPPRRPALAAAAASLTSTECRFSWTRLTGALPRPLQMGGPDAGFHIVRHEALIAAMVAHFKSLPPGHIVRQRVSSCFSHLTRDESCAKARLAPPHVQRPGTAAVYCVLHRPILHLLLEPRPHPASRLCGLRASRL